MRPGPEVGESDIREVYTFVTDEACPGIFKVDPEGILTILAGTGVDGYSGDGGPRDRSPAERAGHGCAGPDGDLYIADWGNNRIRRVALGP
jgi:NHL repeat